MSYPDILVKRDQANSVYTDAGVRALIVAVVFAFGSNLIVKMSKCKLI
jgi:hypothetical protein